MQFFQNILLWEKNVCAKEDVVDEECGGINGGWRSPRQLDGIDHTDDSYFGKEKL